jgi:hypothetical protein
MCIADAMTAHKKEVSHTAEAGARAPARQVTDRVARCSVVVTVAIMIVVVKGVEG